MGRDKIKSASLHGFHDEHVEPLPPTPAAGTRTPFETLVREMLAQLGDDPTREGLRQTPTRVGVWRNPSRVGSSPSCASISRTSVSNGVRVPAAGVGGNGSTCSS